MSIYFYTFRVVYFFEHTLCGILLLGVINMKRLKELREQKQITQAQLSACLKISPSTIGMYEQGRREPDNEILIKLADFFNVSTDYLLDRTDIQNPQQTIAAHRTDDPMNELPEEALKSIEDFKKYIYQKHGIKYD